MKYWYILTLKTKYIKNFHVNIKKIFYVSALKGEFALNYPYINETSDISDIL